METNSLYKFIALGVLLGILLGLGGVLADSVRCQSTAALMGKHYQWGVSTGCMIENRPNEWVPFQQYRVFN